jgi:hypothetical protein
VGYAAGDGVFDRGFGGHLIFGFIGGVIAADVMECETYHTRVKRVLCDFSLLFSSRDFPQAPNKRLQTTRLRCPQCSAKPNQETYEQM